MISAKTRRRCAIALVFASKYLLAIWVFGFIWFAGPFARDGFFNPVAAIVWFAALVINSIYIPHGKQRRFAISLHLLIPIAGWCLIRPSHERDWKISFEKVPHSEVSGDIITIHNYRSFDYAEDGTPLPEWSTRTFDLGHLQGMDFFMTRWSSPFAGHPIFSFDFGEQGHCAFTIEAKLEEGEAYSLLAGIYRRYELSYIACDESDAIRVRTNFREGEQVYLYRTIATPEQARARFLEFVASMNDISESPRFYNVISSNCTTAVRSQMSGGFPWDWRVIINGKLDELLYERGMLKTAGLPFPELQKRALINPKVSAHPNKDGFSERVRSGTPAF
ncbi:MAG: DUF4105 domain-containing protein [Akkermansiaceae bacterium]|nr:DUF4105 domain-containing protein [Akkermansiaceae bacterium]